MDNKLRFSVLALLVLAAVVAVFFLNWGAGAVPSDLDEGGPRPGVQDPSAADTQKGKDEILAKTDENRELVRPAYHRVLDAWRAASALYRQSATESATCHSKGEC